MVRPGRLVLQSGFDPCTILLNAPTWPAAFRRCCAA